MPSARNISNSAINGRPIRAFGAPAFQPVKQRDPQSLTLETACAVQRLLHANIGSDLRFAQRAKMHVERLTQGLQLLAAPLYSARPV